MKYAVLLYEDEAIWDAAAEHGRRHYFEAHEAFAKAAAERGVAVVAGEPLRSVSAATTLRRRGDDITVTDGPFAETVEQLGGFYLVEAPNLDDVIEIGRLLIETVEIRPVGHLD